MKLTDDIVNYGLIRGLHQGFQRMIRGYDDTAMWDLANTLDVYLEPIKKYCEQMIEEDPKNLNPKRLKIMRRTLELMEKYEEANIKDVLHHSDTPLDALWSHIGKNITWFWD